MFRKTQLEIKMAMAEKEQCCTVLTNSKNDRNQLKQNKTRKQATTTASNGYVYPLNVCQQSAALFLGPLTQNSSYNLKITFDLNKSQHYH